MLCWSRGLNSKKRKAFTKRCNKDSLNWKLRLPPGRFGLFMPLNQQAKKEVTVLVMTRVTDPDYQGEIRFLLHNGDKGEYV